MSVISPQKYENKYSYLMLWFCTIDPEWDYEMYLVVLRRVGKLFSKM